MAEKRVTLMSSEGKKFEVDEAVAFESQTVKNMIEDTGMDAPIPLPNVSSKGMGASMPVSSIIFLTVRDSKCLQRL